MAASKILIDLQQLFDQRGVPAAAGSVEHARHEMMRASRLASHHATDACTQKTLMDAFNKKQCECSRYLRFFNNCMNYSIPLT